MTYTIHYWDSKYNETYKENVDTLTHALIILYRSQNYSRKKIIGMTITAPDKRYPKGIRKVGEYINTGTENGWLYTKYVNNFELAPYKIARDGSVYKIKQI